MLVSTYNLGIIGAGNMASSIVKGVIKNKLYNPKQILVYDVLLHQLDKLARETSISKAMNNIDLMEKCSTVIIAVKPEAYNGLLDEIVDVINPHHILISIAAGISTDYIKKRIKNKCRVVRVMPNTPAMVGEGMSAICNNHGLEEDEISKVRSIFMSLGKIELVDEALINAVTAISGSSPAYVYMFIEALADGGVMMGLSREQSYRMAAQSVLGAAKMVLDLDQHPGVLKDMVTSPGGTTIEAVYTLEKNGFRGSIMEAVRNCCQKGALMDKKAQDREGEAEIYG
ncbi:MAG TPA: pyrroline-5-carboxylate reductase [Clostridiales bacterium]|nr:pyrroline-5-carboxylate reductase [Clostridiales bacterium]